ncbi:tetratricopeptide repeat protein [Maricaulis salignorans]|uniref:tetratricopeptide repeat protein n=1 Tax=Maricaulis salignorans TaxID=144026 RepID=UPI003A94840D
MNLSEAFQLGDWRIEPRANRLTGPDGVRDVEPKVMDLLVLLAGRPEHVLAREEIAAAIWPGVIVNDDAMARCVWKLRQALGDTGRTRRYVETVPKRGYRLTLTPAALPGEAGAPAGASERRPRRTVILAALALVVALLAAFAMTSVMKPDRQAADSQLDQLVRRGDDFYYQFAASDNEAARRLYQQALDLDPDYAPALAGLANTLTQRAVRFAPGMSDTDASGSRLAAVLRGGGVVEPTGRRQLAQAEALARRAVAAAPSWALAWRALGLAVSAQGDLDSAIDAYDRALVLDPDAWEAHMNLGDLYEIRGEPDLALMHMEQAYEAMSRVYDEHAVLIRPWYSETGLLIARRHGERGDAAAAELWYRRILYWDPYNADALRELAGLLRDGGDMIGADALCAELASRTELRCEG